MKIKKNVKSEKKQNKTKKKLVHRIREMASFELSKEVGKDVFLSFHEHETKKNF